MFVVSSFCFVPFRVGLFRFACFVNLQDAWDYVHNPYGLLRTPWNTDPTPYITRHNKTNAQVRACLPARLCGTTWCYFAVSLFRRTIFPTWCAVANLARPPERIARLFLSRLRPPIYLTGLLKVGGIM